MERQDDWAQDVESALRGGASSPMAARLARGFRAMPGPVPSELADLAKALMPAKERKKLSIRSFALGESWAGARGGGSGHVVVEAPGSTLRLSFEETEDGFLVQGRIGAGHWFLDTQDGPVEIEPGKMFEQTVPTNAPLRFWNAEDEFEVPPLGTIGTEGA